MPSTAERIAALKKRTESTATTVTKEKANVKDRAKPKRKAKARPARKANPGSKTDLSRGQRAFVDLYTGGPDSIRGNGTACYRFLHPRASERTSGVEACKYLKLPKIKKYLDEKAQLVSEKTTMNAAKVLAESIEMLAMAKGLIPQINEFVTTVKGEDGVEVQVVGRNELCTTNLAMIAKALELIGRNIGVRAFEDSVTINHSHDLERMLNDRGKALEAGARERMKLVSND